MYWDDILRQVLAKGKAKTKTTNKAAKSISIKKAVNKPRRANYYLGKDFPGIYFTPRENDCVRAMLKGFPLKEIAKNLGLSGRSVDFYLKKAKSKLGCRKRAEMLALLAASDFAKK